MWSPVVLILTLRHSSALEKVSSHCVSGRSLQGSLLSLSAVGEPGLLSLRQQGLQGIPGLEQFREAQRIGNRIFAKWD